MKEERDIFKIRELATQHKNLIPLIELGVAAAALRERERLVCDRVDEERYHVIELLFNYLSMPRKLSFGEVLCVGKTIVTLEQELIVNKTTCKAEIGNACEFKIGIPCYPINITITEWSLPDIEISIKEEYAILRMEFSGIYEDDVGFVIKEAIELEVE